MLSKINLAYQDKYCMASLKWRIYKKGTHKTHENYGSQSLRQKQHGEAHHIAQTFSYKMSTFWRYKAQHLWQWMFSLTLLLFIPNNHSVCLE